MAKNYLNGKKLYVPSKKIMQARGEKIVHLVYSRRLLNWKKKLFKCNTIYTAKRTNMDQMTQKAALFDCE